MADMTEREGNIRKVGPLEEGFNKFASNKDVLGQIEHTAELSAQAGLEQELQFIFGKWPRLLQEFVVKNERALALVQEFGHSPVWLSRALTLTFDLTYENVYRSLKQASIRPWVGDVTIYPRKGLYKPKSPEETQSLSVAPDIGEDFRIQFYIEQGLQEFSLQPESYLEHLRREIQASGDETTKRVSEGVYSFYERVYGLEFPTLARQLVDERSGRPRRDSLGNEIFFPSAHQKVAILKAAEEESFAVFDETGSGKSAIVIGLAEYTGARSILVICPNNVKREWLEKLNEYYVERPHVQVIQASNAEKFIKNPLIHARYVVVNYELLVSRSKNGNGNGSPEALNPLGQALLQREFDLTAVDEAHYINNASKRSNAILELAKSSRRRIILTATPVRNHVDDLSRILYIIDPTAFPTPDALSKQGEKSAPFLQSTLSRKTIRRKTGDLVELPPFCPETGGETNFIKVTPNPTQRAIYDVILEDPELDMLSKIILLRQTAIDHNLVMGGKYKLPFDLRDSMRMLQKACTRWQKLKEEGVEINFDSDFLVEQGFRYLFLAAHFHYRRGIDEFVRKHASTQIKESWQGVTKSTKLQELDKLVTESLMRGEKVLIFSGHFVKGILQEILDDVSGEKIMEDLYSHLKTTFDGIQIARIFGDITSDERKREMSPRRKEQKSWQDNPNCKILLANIPSSSLGADYTVNDGETTGVTIVGIDFPYTWADFWQMISRVYRFKQETPVRVHALLSEDSIDEGIKKLILAKKDVQDQTLDGVLPNDLEKQILDRSKTAKSLESYLQSPRKELIKIWNSMTGGGMSKIIDYLGTYFSENKTTGQILAELYNRYWEYTYPGHTLRLVSQIVTGLRQLGVQFKTVVDVGSGPLTFQRTIANEDESLEQMSIINVDINSNMLEEGMQEMAKLGYIVKRSSLLAKPMSETGINSGSADAVVCSLAFDHTNPAEDRAKTLLEANRILKTGGFYILTFTEKSVDKTQFKKFCALLSKFGFKVEKRLTGLARATDYKEAPFSAWVVVAQKFSTPSASGISLDDFHFRFEAKRISKLKNDTSGKDRYEEKIVKHQQFAITDPNEISEGEADSLDEILRRIGLGISKDQIREMGWVVELRKGGKFVIRR